MPVDRESFRKIAEAESKSNIQHKTWTKEDFEKLFDFSKPRPYSELEKRIILASAIFIQNDIYPDDYLNLYLVAMRNPIINKFPYNNLILD